MVYLWNIYGKSMEYLRNIYGISVEYLWYIYLWNILMGYSTSKIKINYYQENGKSWISMVYQQDIHGIFIRYSCYIKGYTFQ